MGLFDGKKGLAAGEDDKLGTKLDSMFFPTADDEDAAAYDALQEQMKQFQQLKLPELQKMDFGDYEWLEDLNAQAIEAGPDLEYSNVDPRLAESVLAGESRFNDISVDPRLQDKQMASLDALQAIADGGGRTLADDANLNRIQNEVSAADRGRREAILSGMSARGMGGSGMELLAQLDSAEAATTRANQGGLDIAAQAQDRALDAILQGGNLAGGIRGQDFGEQTQIAQANDAISKFNAGLSTNNNQFNSGQSNNMAQFNTGNQMQTGMYNLDKNRDTSKFNAGMAFDAAKYNNQGKQGVADSNVDQGNKEQMYNKNTIPQQDFANASAKAAGVAAGYGDLQDYWTGQGTQKLAEGKDNREGAAKIAATAAAASDERSKKDIKELSSEDIDQFLSAVKPKSFKYKNPDSSGTTGGDRLGFLLQDVQGTKVGKAITRKDDDGQLMYDKENLDGVLLAALASITKEKRAS